MQPMALVRGDYGSLVVVKSGNKWENISFLLRLTKFCFTCICFYVLKFLTVIFGAVRSSVPRDQPLMQSVHAAGSSGHQLYQNKSSPCSQTKLHHIIIIIVPRVSSASGHIYLKKCSNNKSLFFFKNSFPVLEKTSEIQLLSDYDKTQAAETCGLHNTGKTLFLHTSRIDSMIVLVFFFFPQCEWF